MDLVVLLQIESEESQGCKQYCSILAFASRTLASVQLVRPVKDSSTSFTSTSSLPLLLSGRLLIKCSSKKTVFIYFTTSTCSRRLGELRKLLNAHLVPQMAVDQSQWSPPISASSNGSECEINSILEMYYNYDQIGKAVGKGGAFNYLTNIFDIFLKKHSHSTKSTCTGDIEM